MISEKRLNYLETEFCSSGSNHLSDKEADELISEIRRQRKVIKKLVHFLHRVLNHSSEHFFKCSCNSLPASYDIIRAAF